MLTTSSLSIGYRNRVLVSGLNLTLASGQLACLIGPNGAGKSTLLRTLAGMQAPLGGEVRLAGENLHNISPARLAQRLAVVLTDRVEAGAMRVSDLVALGRHPYTNWLGNLSAADEAALTRALQLTNTLPFRSRLLAQLSDGERQKVMIARALAQILPNPGDPAQPASVLLLDEPTAFLDLPRRVELLLLLRTLARQTGIAILLSTHDLDLALRVADWLWLLSSTGQMSLGLPEELALNGTLAHTFAGEGIDFDHASGAFRVYQPLRGQISLDSQHEGITAAWTWRALERLGYRVQNGGIRHPLHVEVLNASHWRLSAPPLVQEFTSLAELIAALQNG
jgi:iron complex transport system ATP-binding protein